MSIDHGEVRVEPVRFRMAPERMADQLEAFNARREVAWFGLEGSWEPPGTAVVRFTRLDEAARSGVLGGGGVAAINGGVIAAGFDAVAVLAALSVYDAEAVVTLTLQVHFMRLARASDGLEFRAQVNKGARQVCFVEARLIDRHAPEPVVLALATATLAPRS